MMAKKDRIGERFITKEGYEFVIVEYNGYHDLIVEFQDEYKARVHTEYKCCQSGKVKNPYHKSVCGVGCLGVGNFKTGVDGKNTREYELWYNMLNRCYIGGYHTYANVTVCDRWLVYANFLEDLPKIEGYQLWLNNPNQHISLDKDIKQQEIINKVYSLETVKFVTRSENSKEVCKRIRINYEYKKVKVICLETKQVFNSIKDADQWCGSSKVGACCQGKRSTAGGYKWQYLEDYKRQLRMNTDINNSKQLVA